jgi:hypothetical protein
VLLFTCLKLKEQALGDPKARTLASDVPGICKQRNLNHRVAERKDEHSYLYFHA